MTFVSRWPLGQRLKIGDPWQETHRTMFLRLRYFLQKFSISGFSKKKIRKSNHSGHSLHRHRPEKKIAAVLQMGCVLSKLPTFLIAPQLSSFIIYVIFLEFVTSHLRLPVGKSFHGSRLINPPLIFNTPP